MSLLHFFSQEIICGDGTVKSSPTLYDPKYLFLILKLNIEEINIYLLLLYFSILKKESGDCKFVGLWLDMAKQSQRQHLHLATQKNGNRCNCWKSPTSSKHRYLLHFLSMFNLLLRRCNVHCCVHNFKATFL